MAQYYKHYKGKIYQLLYIAKHSETLEEHVVYQAMYGNKDIWIRPKQMFFETIIKDGKAIKRFSQISKAEGFGKDTTLHTFPDIDYHNQLDKLSDSENFSSVVKGMITLLTSHNIVPSDFFDKYHSDDDIEAEILSRISSYTTASDVEAIFHLIQTWGGMTGRGIYLQGDGFDWGTIKPPYMQLVNACLSTQSLNAESIKKLSEAVRQADKSIKHLSVSYLTKHVRYWLYHTLRYNALPIYDSIISKGIMHKTHPHASHLEAYWLTMLAKSQELGIDLMPLERQLFKYFYSNPAKKN